MTVAGASGLKFNVAKLTSESSVFLTVSHGILVNVEGVTEEGEGMGSTI